MIQSSLGSWQLYNKTVFLRADLNVPLVNGHIASDFRLKALLPTLNILVTKGARIVLATHLGRPKRVNTLLSTQLLLPWFVEHGYRVCFAPTIERAHELLDHAQPGEIIVLENMRFFPQEQTPDIQFARQLAALACYYVTDAFGVLHRTDTSVALMPQLYTRDCKTIGLLVEKELSVLARLKHNPPRPFAFVLGGGKIKDKIPLLAALLVLNTLDTVLLCPAVSFTFLKVLGCPTGNSLVEESMLEQAQYILTTALNRGIKLLLPLDYLITSEASSLSRSLKPPFVLTPAHALGPHNSGVSFGPETLRLYRPYLEQASTIFINGASCIAEYPSSCPYFYALLQAAADSPAWSIVAGGDSVAGVYALGIEKSISFCSTGGGATLTYLSDKLLPGLESILT